MLDLFIAHDLIQRRANDRFEMGSGAEAKIQGATNAQRHRGDTTSALGGAEPLQRLPLGRSLARMGRLIAGRRSTTRTAADC